MKWKIIFMALAQIIEHLDSSAAEKMLDNGIDYIEEKYKTNAAIIAICKFVRAVGSIEDND